MKLRVLEKFMDYKKGDVVELNDRIRQVWIDRGYVEPIKRVGRPRKDKSVKSPVRDKALKYVG